jgi:drug/metabolite transporter (DMT)-like permease
MTSSKALRTAPAGAALLGFAFNSLLCRMALRPDLIDAASFSAVRFASGAAAMVALAAWSGTPARRSSLLSGAILFGYAIPFSLAYRRLDAGLGSLVLFGTVQVTMIGWGLFRGEKPPAVEWAGLTLSLGGLVALVFPSLTAPPLGSAALMAFAGICWAVYSLRGRGSAQPLADTAWNFVVAAPLTIASAGAGAGFGLAHATARGAAYAVASGAVASGLGYALWYRALPQLTRARAAIVQLAVPVVAALGGVLLLGEQVSLRLALAGTAILGGVALAVLGPRT